MAVVRDILTHVDVEIASRPRICHRNRQNHRITKGQKCLAVYESGGGRKNYCVPCAMPILVNAKTKLLSLEQNVQSG